MIRVQQQFDKPFQATSKLVDVQDDLARRLGTLDDSLTTAIPRQKHGAKLAFIAD